ncbi:hypothetical protein EAM_P212 (plasmid) [Erwinia amylovora ATCC 49946]|nr:hypothetical protein EAM_P212 [Erwinia amylovora ATCC 49946]
MKKTPPFQGGAGFQRVISIMKIITLITIRNARRPFRTVSTGMFSCCGERSSRDDHYITLRANLHVSLLSVYRQHVRYLSTACRGRIRS